MSVVSFRHYKAGRGYVALNEPCERPFHLDGYILTTETVIVCARCNVDVRKVTHPSFEGERWYG
jgi:hypothetical protein